VSQSSNKLNRTLTQAFGILLGIAIACWGIKRFGYSHVYTGRSYLAVVLRGYSYRSSQLCAKDMVAVLN
jgi:flagellar biogenesis protein FliO